jgi:hypothetical protein
MPARRQHVRRCGDLERSCTDVLLYLQLNGSSQNPNMYLTRRSIVGLRGFKLTPALLAHVTSPLPARIARPRGGRRERRITKRLDAETINSILRP